MQVDFDVLTLKPRKSASENVVCLCCYGLALLPSIICLGRLRIASKHIFTLWQLRQGVDSLAQWLEHWIFNREDRVRFPGKTEYFFSYASIPLLRLSCRKMGARPGLDFIRRKWLHVIINDDFLEKGECYGLALLPSIICLGRLRIASKHIFTLWQLRQGVDSLAQWLEHWIFNREDRVRFPGKTEYFFSYASIPLLRLSCRKNVVCWIFLQTFQTYFCIQPNSVDTDQTSPRGAVWSGSTLFAKMTFSNHKQMRKQTIIFVIGSLRVKSARWVPNSVTVIWCCVVWHLIWVYTVCWGQFYFG